jgi:hypothetical protein
MPEDKDTNSFGMGLPFKMGKRYKFLIGLETPPKKAMPISWQALQNARYIFQTAYDVGVHCRKITSVSIVSLTFFK